MSGVLKARVSGSWVPIPTPIIGPTLQTDTSTGTQNNFSLSDFYTYLKWNGASDVTFSGFTVAGNAPSSGASFIIDNLTTTKKITLKNEGTGSTAANRVTVPEAADTVIGPAGRVVLFYDTGASRWRAVNIAMPLWDSGPWILDPVNGAAIARKTSTDTSGTFNDYNPTGLASMIMLEFEPAAATITLTGLTAPSPVSAKIMIIGNRDSGAGTVVINHQDTNSAAANRFRLPGNVNMTLAAGEYAMMYYDPSAGRWRMLITAQSSGGITTTVVTAANVKVFKATRKITHAEILALNSTPIQIVAAPGSGFHIDVISASWVKDTSAGAYTAASSNLNLTYGSAGAVSVVTALGWSPTAASKVWGKFAITTNTSTATTNAQNKGIFAINNSVNPTGGNSANYLTIEVVYAIVDETAAT